MPARWLGFARRGDFRNWPASAKADLGATLGQHVQLVPADSQRIVRQRGAEAPQVAIKKSSSQFGTMPSCEEVKVYRTRPSQPEKSSVDLATRRWLSVLTLVLDPNLGGHQKARATGLPGYSGYSGNRLKRRSTTTIEAA